MTTGKAGTGQTLRQLAEERYLKESMQSASPETLSPEDTRQMMHELLVHQIELEMQNEELRLSQESLDAAHARYVDLYDLAPVGYCTIAESGLILEANLTAANLLGVTRCALENRLMSDFVLNEDQDIFYLYRKRLCGSDKPRSCELRMVKHDGTPFLAQMEANSVKAADKAVARVTLTDVTERRQAARLLAEARVIAESEQKFRKITESAQDAIIMMGADKRISLWNQSAERIFGHTAGEALGREMHPLIAPPEMQAPFERGFENFLNTGTGPIIGKTHELTALRKGGEQFPVECTISALRIDDAWNAIGIFRDITRRKLAERKIQDYIAQQAVMMREMHHRVKNNMQTMSALLELQASYVKDEQALAYFRESQQRIQSMAMIHEQLYLNEDISRIDFTAYLHSLVDNLRGQYGGNCKNVNIRIDAQPCTIPLDVAIPCGLIVNELVSNAMKHAFPDGRAGELLIGLKSCGEGRVVLEVADDGMGMPPELDLHHGRSFGMRLVTLLVEKQLHGRISVGNEEHGTRIQCEIEVQNSP